MGKVHARFSRSVMEVIVMSGQVAMNGTEVWCTTVSPREHVR